MSTDEAWLEQVHLIDCTGQISHTLTLRVDGKVDIRFREGHSAVVDPATRRCLTPGMTLHTDLLAAASALRPAP